LKSKNKYFIFNNEVHNFLRNYNTKFYKGLIPEIYTIRSKLSGIFKNMIQFNKFSRRHHLLKAVTE